MFSYTSDMKLRVLNQGLACKRRKGRESETELIYCKRVRMLRVKRSRELASDAYQ